jgi:hypothetical protein
VPDKNVQLPDGRVVAFPDSMADADISAVIKKQLSGLSPAEQTRQRTLQNMTAAMSGQKMQTPADQAQFEAGKKAGAVSAAETTGGVLGGEAAPALKGLTGALLRVFSTGGGAAAGNIAGQVGTTGTVDPLEALKSAATWGSFAGAGEFAGALGDVRNALRDLIFTPEGKVTELGKAVSHPVDAAAEYALRKSLGAPDVPVKGESVPMTQSPNYLQFKAAKANAYQEAKASISTQTSAGESFEPGGKIVTPLSPAPPINRTLVSYDRDLLAHMARGGDLNALRELIRNPGGINVAEAVPNSKYLLEPGQPTNIYGGPK